jgi:XTP/dITP diphosphohydrolase
VRSKNEEDILREHSCIVYFATTNRGKFREAARITTQYGINLKQLRHEKQEIQSNDLEEIASLAAKHAAQSTGLPVVAEDSGFFVNALKGFPGPYSSYAFKTLGSESILKLVGRNTDRTAFFLAAVAFCSPKMRPRCFTGVVNGRLTGKPRGTNGFGFDPIFMPNRGNRRTFAEMTTDEKNAMSHRALAFRKFSDWFATAL